LNFEKKKEKYKENSEALILIEEEHQQKILELKGIEFEETGKEQEKELEELADFLNKELELEIDAIDKKQKAEEDAAEESIKIAEEEAKAKEELRAKEFDAAIDGIKAIFEYRSQLLSNEITEIERKRDIELEAIDDQLTHELITEEQAATSKKNINDKSEKEANEYRRKKAENDKLMAIFEIAIAGAIAVVNALGEGSFVLGALMALAVAAELAIVISQPIPEFEEGGKHKGGVARFSEKGKSELFFPKRGGVYLTPEKETIANMPEGEFVEHSKSMEMMRNSLYFNNDMKEFTNNLGKMINKPKSFIIEMDGRPFLVINERNKNAKNWINLHFN